MRSKDTYKDGPEEELRLRHPCILPEMRAMLVYWAMNVCDVLLLERETTYLAIEIYDRYMDTRHDVQGEQIYPIGLSCLCIASKNEERCRVRLKDFAHFPTGKYSCADMKEMEYDILTALDWRICRDVTVNSWVRIYMQIRNRKFQPSWIKPKPFELPAFSKRMYVRVMQVLDICILDIDSRQFGSSVLAASAYYLMTESSKSDLAFITGYEFVGIREFQITVYGER